MRLVLALAFATAAWGQPAASNQCLNAASCALQVVTGDLVLVKVSGQAAAGSITNSQGIALTARGHGDTWKSHDVILSGIATATENLTVASSLTEGLIAIARFTGYSDALAGSQAAADGDAAQCPATGALTATPAVDALAISTWVEDSGHANACTGSTGAAITPGICPDVTGLLSQWNWAPVTANAPASQVWTIAPNWNSGTRNCGMYLFPKSAIATPAAPVISNFTAGPASIAPGQSSLLTWTVTGATTISLDHGVGVINIGAATVNPSASTTYTLTATGPGGTTTATASVTVTAAPVLTTTLDRPALVALLGLTVGPDLQLVDTGGQLVLSRAALTRHCIPQASALTWTITQQQHGRTDDGLSVTLYDGQKPRHTISADWTLDPDTLTVVVTFASPQAGCAVVQ